MKGGESMTSLNAHKTGLVVGSFFGFMHIVWSLMVAIGLVRPWIDFISGLHFLEISYTMKPFQLGNAFLLVVVTAVIGYIVGLVFSTIWNKLQK